MCCIRDWNVYFEFISAVNNISTTKLHDEDDQQTNIRTKLES